jgi:hypothetical protein
MTCRQWCCGPTACASCSSFTGQKQDGVDYAFTREQDVDLALFPLHDVKQPVEFVEIGRITKACLVAPQGFTSN